MDRKKKGLFFSGPPDRPISLLRTQIFSYFCEDGADPILTSQHIAESNSPRSVRRDELKSYVTSMKDYGIADISNISVELSIFDVLRASMHFSVY